MEDLNKNNTSPSNVQDSSYFQLSPKSQQQRGDSAENSSVSVPDVQMSEIGEGGGASGGGGSSGRDEKEYPNHIRKRKANQNDSASSETDDRTSGEVNI